MSILVCNRGSSTLKSCLYACADSSLPAVGPPAPLREVLLDWTGAAAGVALRVRGAGEEIETILDETEDSALVAKMLATLWSRNTQVRSDTQPYDDKRGCEPFASHTRRCHECTAHIHTPSHVPL